MPANLTPEYKEAERQLRGQSPSLDELLGPIRPGAGLPWGYLLPRQEQAALLRDWKALVGR